MNVAADPCPECGGDRDEMTSWPDNYGRCEVFLVCSDCGLYEPLDVVDGVL